jgi:hypothetical protein
VSKYEGYQRHAAECLLLAKSVKDEINRAVLLEMAQSWMDLAEREEHTIPVIKKHSRCQMT